MDKDKLPFLSIKKLRLLLLQKKISPTELIKLFLERIHALNPDLQAFSFIMDNQALDEAKKIEMKIKEGDTKNKPLLGIPVAVSDRIDVKDIPTSMGSELLKDHIATQNHLEVQRLIDAGAIIIGKTNCSEFGLSSLTHNQIYGGTRNPEDPNYILGGSEGGVACAVSSGLATIGIGIDTMGSVRLPCGYCGIYGLKTSRGRIPIERAISLPLTTRSFMSISPLARSLEDTELLFSNLVESKHKKPASKPLKIGFSPNLNITHPSQEVVDKLQNCLRDFEKKGHSTHKISFEMTHDILMHFTNLYSADLYFPLLSIMEKNSASIENVTEYTRLWLDKGKQVKGIAYSMGLVYKEWLENHISKLFETYDIILTSTSPYPPFKLSDPPEHIIGDDLHSVIALWEQTLPFNMSGHPAITIPYGTSKNGHPIGIQAIAPLNQDEELLQFASLLI